MKTLKESILSRSSHGAKGFDAQRREMIEKWLKEYNIKNYTINDDFTIDVNGNVFLSREDFKEFPEYIQFGIIRGGFYCSLNHLSSLRGCPREVEGDFNCIYNELTSLEGAPIIVRGDFYCNNNRLTSLKGAPKEVGGNFMCYNNKLTSLKEAPKKVGKDFICFDNGSVRFTEDDVRKVCDVGIKITV